MKLNIAKYAVVCAVFVITVFGATVAAHTADARVEQAQEQATKRLEGVKLKRCDNRERVINKILDRIAARGEKRLSVYTAIFERVQDFYTKKNLSVSNYDELVANVNARKDAAQAAVDLIKGKNIEFKCDGTDPKRTASGFKSDLKAEIQALHEYQQALKDFIVVVKKSVSDSAQNNNNSGEGEQEQ